MATSIIEIKTLKDFLSNLRAASETSFSKKEYIPAFESALQKLRSRPEITPEDMEQMKRALDAAEKTGNQAILLASAIGLSGLLLYGAKRGLEALSAQWSAQRQLLPLPANPLAAPLARFFSPALRSVSDAANGDFFFRTTAAIALTGISFALLHRLYCKK